MSEKEILVPLKANSVTLSYERNTERGIMLKLQKLSVACVFQRAPVWLLSLNVNTLEKVYMISVDSFNALTNHLTSNNCDTTLYNSIVSHLSRNIFTFVTPPSDVLYLVSGDVSFLNDQYELLREKRFIFTTDKHKIFRKVPVCWTPLRRLKHVQVGGGYYI